MGAKASYRQVVSLLQVLALVAFPQMTKVAHADMAMFDEVAASASSSHHSDVGGLTPSTHHHTVASDSSIPDSAIFINPSAKEGMACHPCCVAGTGPCIAILPTVQKFSVSRQHQTFDIFWPKSFHSRPVAPLPHPPKLYS